MLHLHPGYDDYMRQMLDVEKTDLLGPNKSALPISSATIARKSWMCSDEAPCVENADTHERIQSGHREGCPGTSFKAKDVS